MSMFPVLILWYLMTISSDLLISVLLWSWIILEEVLRHLPTTAALDAILRLSPEALTHAPPFPHQQHLPVHPIFWKLNSIFPSNKPCQHCKQCQQCKQCIARCYLHLWCNFIPHYPPHCHYKPYHRVLLLIIIMAFQQIPTAIIITQTLRLNIRLLLLGPPYHTAYPLTFLCQTPCSVT